jgi:hypothetical protein
VRRQSTSGKSGDTAAGPLSAQFLSLRQEEKAAHLLVWRGLEPPQIWRILNLEHGSVARNQKEAPKKEDSLRRYLVSRSIHAVETRT